MQCLPGTKNIGLAKVVLQRPQDVEGRGHDEAEAFPPKALLSPFDLFRADFDGGDDAMVLLHPPRDDFQSRVVLAILGKQDIAIGWVVEKIDEG